MLTEERQFETQPGGGGDSLIKVGTNVRARALGISGLSFCPCIRFWAIVDKRCVIFDKRVKK